MSAKEFLNVFKKGDFEAIFQKSFRIYLKLYFIMR